MLKMNAFKSILAPPDVLQQRLVRIWSCRNSINNRNYLQRVRFHLEPCESMLVCNFHSFENNPNLCIHHIAKIWTIFKGCKDLVNPWVAVRKDLDYSQRMQRFGESMGCSFAMWWMQRFGLFSRECKLQTSMDSQGSKRDLTMEG